MNKRTHLYLSVVIPVKSRLRRYAIYLMENAIDRLDIDKCHRYDDSYSFRDFINDDELFMFDDDNDNQ
jgi:hypothetical protein